MSREDFRIMIADVPDKEEPVCEIYYKNSGWVQISAEVANKFVVAFCNKDDGSYWEIPYEETLEILQEAKEYLSKSQRTLEERVEHEAWAKKYEGWKPTPEEQKEYEAKMEAQRKKYDG